MPPKTRSQVSEAAASSVREPNSDGIRQRPREGSRSRTIDDVYDAKYAVDLATVTVDENVFLFIPNLIGYLRVVLAGASLYYMPRYPVQCTLLYGISCLLDAVDGLAARYFNQSSRFGAVLDMVTDRCTTACLLCFLASAECYRDIAIIFQFLIALDFASHYIHMYSSLVTGSSSHKKITSDVSRILYYYYNDKLTLFIFCFCNELFFVCLYLNAYVTKPISPIWLPSVVARIAPRFTALAATLTWPQLIGALNFPICFGKQVINIVQFWKASKILVGIDLQDRQRERERKARAQALENAPAQAVVL